MSGQMINYKKYNNYVSTLQEPISLSQLPKIKFNINEVAKYAKNKGVKVSELTEEDKRKLIHY